MKSNEEVYEQACADVERSKSRAQEVDELVHEIETNALPPTDLAFSKQQLVPLIHAWRSQNRELDELRQVVARTKLLEQDARGDTGNCFEGAHPEGRTHRYQSVHGLTNGGGVMLFCVRCGRVLARDFIGRPM